MSPGQQSPCTHVALTCGGTLSAQLNGCNCARLFMSHSLVLGSNNAGVRVHFSPCNSAGPTGGQSGSPGCWGPCASSAPCAGKALQVRCPRPSCRKCLRAYVSDGACAACAYVAPPLSFVHVCLAAAKLGHQEFRSPCCSITPHPVQHGPAQTRARNKPLDWSPDAPLLSLKHLACTSCLRTDCHQGRVAGSACLLPPPRQGAAASHSARPVQAALCSSLGAAPGSAHSAAAGLPAGPGRGNLVPHYHLPGLGGCCCCVPHRHGSSGQPGPGLLHQGTTSASCRVSAAEFCVAGCMCPPSCKSWYSRLRLQEALRSPG